MPSPRALSGRSGLRAALTCGAAVTLAGCAASATSTGAAPPLASLPQVPVEFTAATNPAPVVDDRWWTTFGDDRLDGLIAIAVAQSPLVGQAAAQAAQARAAAQIARADRLPQIGAGLGATGFGGAGNAGLENRLDLSLAVSWEADLWGRLAAQDSAARAEYLASEAGLRSVRQAVAAQTARTYFAVIEANDQVALSRRVLETYDELSRQLELRVAAGIDPLSLQALVITDQQSARGGLELRREDHARLIRQLEILLRDYPDGQVAVAAALPPLPPLPATGMPAQMLARRPDVAAAELRLRATGLRVDAAQRSLLPALVLDGSTGASGTGLAALLDGPSFVWSIAGRLLQPVFQGGRLRAQIDQREGEADEAIEAYAEVALNALFEVETALAIETSLAAREAAFLSSAEAAEQAVEISTKRYRAGIESFFNVLETQQRALNARSAYLSTRRDRLTNRVNLHTALGGGFGGS